MPSKDAAGAPVTIAIGTYDVQFLAASSIADPATVRLLKMYEAMDRGDFAPAAQILQSMASDTIKMRGMPEAMDIASGVSDATLAVVEKQAATSLLADALNFPMPHLRGQLGVPDLGEPSARPCDVGADAAGDGHARRPDLPRRRSRTTCAGSRATTGSTSRTPGTTSG